MICLCAEAEIPLPQQGRYAGVCAKLSKWNGNSLKTEQVRFGLPFGSDLGESLAFLLLGGGRNQLRP